MSEKAFRAYLTDVETEYKAGRATEHTYRGALETLLESLGGIISKKWGSRAKERPWRLIAASKLLGRKSRRFEYSVAKRT